MLGSCGVGTVPFGGSCFALLSLAPVSVVAPVATPAVPKVGQTVTSTNGTWTNAPTFYTYQWRRGPNPSGPFVDVAGANGSLHTATESDRDSYLVCVVTAHNALAAGSAQSNSVGAVQDPVVVGELGCGSYEAYVLARGGGTLVAVLPWNQLDWERVLDDTSQATVSVEGECAALGGVRPWQHEVAVYRDGVLVWVGPLVNPTGPVSGDHQSILLVARDLSVWWDHRRVHNDHNYVVPTDLATIFKDYADDAMSVDNSPGLVVSPTPCGILGTRTILGTQHQIAGLELRDLAKTGIDWTAVGRTILAGGSNVPTASIGTFTDEHFTQPPKPNLDGTAQANDWVVRGAGGGVAGDVVYGEAADPAAQARDGILESVDTVTTIQDNTSAQAAARTRVALTGTILSVEEAYLSPTAPFPIGVLVPGALCQLALEETVVPVNGQYRLQSVKGVARGSDGVEQIALVFQPVGTM